MRINITFILEKKQKQNLNQKRNKTILNSTVNEIFIIIMIQSLNIGLTKIAII